MNLIMNEYTYAEDLINRSYLAAEDLGKKPSATIGLLAKYYRENNKTDAEIRVLIDKFLFRCLKEKYKTSKWIECINHQIKASKKYALKRVDRVNITQSEITIIHNIKEKRTRKVMFTLLVLAKYYNQVNERNHNWVNTPLNVIFKLANSQMKILDQTLIINELYTLGLINISRNVGKFNIVVNFIDDNSNSETVLTITQLRDLGKEYLLYTGENFIRCIRCGALVKPKTTWQKYCVKCQKYSPIKTKTITCIDCGKEVEVDGIVKNKKRCDECQREYIKKYDRERKAKLKENSVF